MSRLFSQLSAVSAVKWPMPVRSAIPSPLQSSVSVRSSSSAESAPLPLRSQASERKSRNAASGKCAASSATAKDTASDSNATRMVGMPLRPVSYS